MALETATYISDLVSTNPTSSDNISQGDDHIRLLKSTVKATFPNVSGAVTPTHTELNKLAGLATTATELGYVNGVTSAIQTQLGTKAASGANTDLTSVYLNNTGLKVKDTDASHGLTIKPGSNLTADRILTVTTGDAARTLDISAADVTISTAGAALIDDASATAQRTTLGLGTAATLNVGTSANNVVQLDGSAKLPAVDGSALTNLPASTATGTLLRAPQIKTSGTSYTTPANCTAIYVELLGGGGGGGGVNNTAGNAAGSGSAGAYASKYFTVTASTAYTYAIGSGGNGGSAGANVGTAGGNTTFTVGATTVTATGGNAGAAGSSNSSKIAASVTATNGDFNGSSMVGYNCGVASSISFGGSSPFGSGGYYINGTSALAGTGYGCGGAGPQSGGSNLAGGAGSQGFIRIWEYA